MTTRVAVLTPDGRGAVAVVRVWGDRALPVADACFRPARGGRLAETATGRPRLGRVGAGLGDEVVAILIGPDPVEVEIQCHGGPAACALVVDALQANGAEPAPAAAWATRHGSTPAAEAAVDLARAPTLRTAEILLDQHLGALEAEIQRLANLIPIDPARALADLDTLIRRGAIGARLVDGWRVALAGRPNVGKSRLLNALAGYDRAIVAPTPGTTRDLVTARVALDGWPVELADTAGLRATDDSVELLGVARARAHQAGADLVVLVLNRSTPIVAADRDLISFYSDALIVANKSDLPAAWEPSAAGALAISAERGEGLDDLSGAIARRLVPEAPPPGSAVPFRPGHCAGLDRARECLLGGDPGGAARALAGLLG